MLILKKTILKRRDSQPLLVLFFLALVFIVCTSFPALGEQNGPKKKISILKGNAPSVELTPKEKSWLAAHPDITLGYPDVFEPEVIANPDGTYSGIQVDFLNALNKRLGIHIKLSIHSVPDVLKKAKSREIDGMPSLHPAFADKMGLIPTQTYYDSYPVVFTLKNESFRSLDDFIGKKIALVDRVYVTQKIIHPYKDRATILKVPDTLSGLQSVQSGKADLFLGVSSSAYYITKYQLFDLVSKYMFFDRPEKFAFGIRSDYPELVSILNKGIASFSQNEMNEMVAKWIYLPQKENRLLLTAKERSWLATHPKITLGSTQVPPWDFINETTGKPDGIAADYISLIGQKLGIQFEYKYDDFGIIHQLAAENKIDGIRVLARTEDRAEYLDFSNPYVTIQYGIATRKTSGSIKSFSDLNYKRVGTNKATAANTYLKKNYPNIELRAINGYDAGLLALLNKEIDAFVGPQATLIYTIRKKMISDLNVTTVAFELSKEMGIGVRKDWPQLTAILNKSIARIDDEEHTAIRDKWLGSFPKKQKILSTDFTPDERAWLNAKHTVRIRVVQWPPFSIVTQEEPKGISIEYLSLIARRTGINLEFVSDTMPFFTALESMKNLQGPDLIPNTARTPEREKSLSFSKDYFSAPRVIYVRSDSEHIQGIEDLSGKTLATVRATVVTRQIETRYPELKLQLYDSDMECLSAVSQGDADAYIGNLTLGAYLILENGLTNLKVGAPSPFGDHVLSFSSRKDWPELSSIINKGLAKITPEEKLAIRNKYLSVRYEHGFNTKEVLKWGLPVAGGAIFIVLLFVFWNRSLKQQVLSRTSELAATNIFLESKIEAHEKAEEDLRKSEERFRATFEQAAVGMAHVSTDGRFLRINQKFCDIVGYSREEMLGLSFQDITHPEDLESDIEKLTQLLAGDISTYSMEKRYLLPKKDVLWVHLTVSLVRNKAAEPQWFVSVIKDISHRKQTEEKIQEYQSRLKALASQLTIVEEKERRRIAAELHDHIGQTLAFSRIQISRAKKYASEEKQAEILEALSQSLLDTIRDTKELVFDLSSPLLNELGLKAAISNMLKEQIFKKHGIPTEFIDNTANISLEDCLGDDLKSILFRNVKELLNNTVKHASAERIVVIMENTQTEFKITIQDNGIGFDPETKIVQGNIEAGFGLFSIKERMADFGGHLNILSKPGKGCQMMLSVPILGQTRGKGAII